MPQSQDNVTIGVNILEILTTGMYRDSRVIFREYIQNSCDQIDAAVAGGLLSSNEGQVELWIDDKARAVSIEDNATGIPHLLFKPTLYSIGESSKVLGEAKGFRGIGHWCGLGYCKTLVFVSKAADENVESVMTCDAEKMRQMMDEHNAHKSRYTIDEVLSATVKFTRNKCDDTNAHYFRTEMRGIRDEHQEICSLAQVKDYLSFVAPVGYAPAFRFRTVIHKHAEIIGIPIQEYNVSVNSEPVRKKYTPTFTTHNKGEDTITDVDFKDFRDDNGNIVAWLWFGISSFKAQILKENQMRGIRLRTQNIQIGGDDALQKLFNEDRGQYYFVGEVFAIARDLIPNSQRDYFNQNEARIQFEHLLAEFFNGELSDIYKKGSEINSAFGKINKAEELQAKATTAEAEGSDIDGELRRKAEQAAKEAETAAQKIVKLRDKTTAKIEAGDFGTSEVVVNDIIERNEKQRANRPNAAVKVSPPKPIMPHTVPPAVTHPTSINVSLQVVEPQFKKPDRLVPVSKIRDIVREFAETSIAEAIIAKIEEELL
jgi:molecular chaperone HtpG